MADSSSEMLITKLLMVLPLLVVAELAGVGDSSSEMTITMVLPLLVVAELAGVGDSLSEMMIAAAGFAAGGTEVEGVAAGEAAARRTSAANVPSSSESGSSKYTYRDGRGF